MVQQNFDQLVQNAWQKVSQNQDDPLLRKRIQQCLSQSQVPRRYLAALNYFLGCLYNLSGKPDLALNYFDIALHSPIVDPAFSSQIGKHYIIALEHFFLIERAIKECEHLTEFFPEEPWFKEHRQELLAQVAAQNYKPQSNVDNWRRLQEQGYFDRHQAYQTEHDLQWTGEDLANIQRFVELQPDMNMAIIGSGYGRESFFLAPHVQWIYGIDVEASLLQRSQNYLKERSIENFTPLLYETWKEQLPAKINLVYCFTVFQHLTKYLVVDYVQSMAPKLLPHGDFICQFMSSEQTGSFDAQCSDHEPHVSWTELEIKQLFERAGFVIKALERELKHAEEGVYWYWVHAQKQS